MFEIPWRANTLISKRDFVKFKKAKWTHSCVREQEQTLLRDERYGEILSDASIAFKCLCP